MQRCGLQKRTRPRDDGFSFRRENSSGRPQKISKWKLEELREGETYSLLAAPGAVAPQALLPDIDIEYFNNVHLSVPSSPSDHGDGGNVTAPRSASRALNRSHTELRSLLRKGIRLKEEDFEVVEILRKKIEPDASNPAGGDQTGGSGEISHVRLKENPNVHCVMKTFFLHLSEENLQDYEQQFTCLYGHQHPNIVPIYDVCFKRVNLVGGWKFFLFMHHADRGSLDSHITRLRPFPSLMLVGLAAQVLEALRFLHNVVHLCHRDVKPSNILIRSDGRVMLQDFGNSRQLQPNNHDMETFVGCTQYMSPERIYGAKYDCKADVWSLGLILMECLLGFFPYRVEGVSTFDFCDAIVTADVPLELLDNIPDLPPLVRTLITCCLQKDREDRPNADMLLLSLADAELIDSITDENVQIQRFDVAGIGLTDFEREEGGPQEHKGQEEEEEEDCSGMRDGLRVRIFATRRSAEHAVAHYVMETS
mmetsp:Transcript_2265/g.5308  ORF Transcript_2265/g.5308 Transcript_2265/m.5308 type:complete len:479 (-) Transcript_2265:80-1516(-)